VYFDSVESILHFTHQSYWDCILSNVKNGFIPKLGLVGSVWASGCAYGNR
jgi:hypothetical protein